MANTSTTTAAVIEKIVSSIVQETLIQSSVVIPLVWNFTSQVRPGMDRIDIARFDQPTVESVTEGTALTQFDSTIVTDMLNLNINEAIHWAISDRANVQSKINVISQVTRDGARSMAAKVDDAIIGQLILASAVNPDHRIIYDNTPTNTFKQADILTARELLNNANIPMSERFILVNTASERSLLEIPDFVRADQYGRTPSALMNGELGTLYGMPVFMSTSSVLLTENRSVVFWRQAVAYATQITSRFDQDRDISKLEDTFSLSMLYGTQVLDGGRRQVLINTTGA